MAPPTPAFPSSRLPEQILSNDKGKRRKDLLRDFDLKRDCELVTMTQYRCEPVLVEKGGKTWKEIQCTPVERLFRKLVIFDATSARFYSFCCTKWNWVITVF